MYRVVDGVIVSEKEFDEFSNGSSLTVKEESEMSLRDNLIIRREPMKAEALYGKPILTGITVTFTLDQANHMVRFLGQTSLETVENLLKDVGYDVLNNINDTVFDLYDALTRVMPDDTDNDMQY